MLVFYLRPRADGGKTILVKVNIGVVFYTRIEERMAARRFSYGEIIKTLFHYVYPVFLVKNEIYFIYWDSCT